MCGRGLGGVPRWRVGLTTAPAGRAGRVNALVSRRTRALTRPARLDLQMRYASTHVRQQVSCRLDHPRGRDGRRVHSLSRAHLAGGAEPSLQQGATGDDPLSRMLREGRHQYDEKMLQAIEAIPESDPLRAWALRFGEVGHVSGDPLIENLFFMPEPAQPPPNLPALSIAESRMLAPRWPSCRRFPTRSPSIWRSWLLTAARIVADLAGHPQLVGLLLKRLDPLLSKAFPQVALRLRRAADPGILPESGPARRTAASRRP